MIIRKMTLASLICALLAALPASSFAQSKYIKTAEPNLAAPVFSRLKTDYATEQPFSITLRTMVVGDSKNADNRLITAQMEVATKGCVGNFSGVGKIVNDRIVLRPYKPAMSDDACKITLEVDKTGESVKVSEQSCSYFHGAACGYSGTLTSTANSR